jgi:hypothetical protein
MDRQLKQTALPCQLGGEHFGGHYLPLTCKPALADVASRVVVCGVSVTAGYAFEGGLIAPVLLVGMSAGHALARCIAGIDEDNWNPGALCLVGYKASELVERPITKPCSLVATSGRDPCADACQSFQGNAASGAFSIQNERLRYAVVGMFLKPRLFAGEFAETALGRFGASLLKALAPPSETRADTLNISPGVGCAVAINGQRDDAEIDAKPVFSFELGCLGDVAGRGQIPLAADEAEIDLALLEGKQAPLMLTHHDGDHHATFERPDACGGAVLHEPEDAIVIRLGGILAEDRRDITVDFEGVGNLGNGSNRHLSGEPESAANVRIGHLVQIELPELTGIISGLGKPRRGLIAASQRRRKRNRLRLRWNELYGGDQLHIFKYREYPLQCQEGRTTFAAAIPLPAKAGSFSRRPL